MPSFKGMEGSFNTVWAEYDKWRPTYVQELYADIFAAVPIGPSSSVLEIGIGTGQATLPVLETGCRLTAVELGADLARYAAEKFSRFPGFAVYNVPFQDFDAPDGSFDLIFSATAFHWIPEEIGYQKVFRLLKSGGVFARFANHPYPDRRQAALQADIQRLYDKYMPRSPGGGEFGEAQAAHIAGLARKYGFDGICYKLYRRMRSFAAGEYTRLLGTYSDHLAIEEGTRRRFFDEVERAIHAHGGVLSLCDTIDLEIARKP